MRNRHALNRNGGYTLLSAMMALAILTVTAALVANVAQAVLGDHAYQTTERKDILIFFQQINDELAGGKDFASSDRRLVFKEDGNTVDYQLIGTNLRRSVNGEGYEILLRNVRSVDFQVHPNDVSISLTDAEGRTYHWVVLKMVK
ncbi:competence type IV pilus minor pilin ComGF [Caenibacillus caldisaponilyticus]|uniref:competence type IV pilus minor pilin ComGF n=1 Tax=Caenibacillus caldisaponilyticus TaxID=1674942 RepID=UPI0013015900|nr:competence type IV pilus minor pilin ComGF [Caenibacillus caldisaponilyticus]